MKDLLNKQTTPKYWPTADTKLGQFIEESNSFKKKKNT